MKLALVMPDGTASCFLCKWQHRVSSQRKDRKTGKLTEISLEDRRKFLDKAVLDHLNFLHDRILVTRSGNLLEEGSEQGKRVYYEGRR